VHIHSILRHPDWRAWQKSPNCCQLGLFVKVWAVFGLFCDEISLQPRQYLRQKLSKE
jgi:hypothetical protein